MKVMIWKNQGNARESIYSYDDDDGAHEHLTVTVAGQDYDILERGGQLQLRHREGGQLTVMPHMANVVMIGVTE